MNTIQPLPPHPSWVRHTASAVVLWTLSRLNDQLPKVVMTPFVRITPQLLVGPQISQRGWHLLRDKFGVTGVVNLRVEADDRERGINPPHYLWLPTIDHTSPTTQQLYKAAVFVSERVKAGEAVYIHCAAGVGRAPMTAIAYLISQGMNVDEARELIRSRRPFINHSGSQRARLLQFAEQYQGKLSHDQTPADLPSPS